MGPSGSGKSTLFRALAGIWPFGAGKVRVPEGVRSLFLPQKTYLPIASLRDAVRYPDPGNPADDDAVREALRAVRLGHLEDRLDEVAHWAQRLSPGEQQRLAIARALLYKPDWLFLDEATASVDEVRRCSELLRERCRPRPSSRSAIDRRSGSGMRTCWRAATKAGRAGSCRQPTRSARPDRPRPDQPRSALARRGVPGRGRRRAGRRVTA